MNSAARMKRLSSRAKSSAAKKQRQAVAAKEKLQQEIDARIKAGIEKEYKKKWLPVIEKAAREQQNSATLMLGSYKGGGEVREMEQLSRRTHLVALLEKEGYEAHVSYPTRKYSDDHLGDEEIDITVKW